MFFDGTEIYSVFEQYGIDCKRYADNEVLIPYALFPQQIVGYYYYKGSQCISYVVNPYYVKVWERNPHMKIGDSIYRTKY